MPRLQYVRFAERFRKSNFTFRLSRTEPLVFCVAAGAAVLVVAGLFYGAMHLQILNARMWADPSRFSALASQNTGRVWSAPLDDVFIHFDFAREIARGHPFEWSDGNGYSSGGTSLLYPFTLAVGYWLGFREQRVASDPSLMLWAAVLACVSVFTFLLASRRLFSSLPRWTTYLAIPFVLGIGALDWTLFSGMEVALFLAVWGGLLVVWDDLTRPFLGEAPTGTTDASNLTRRLWALGGCGALLVTVRPEAVTTVGVFAVGTALCLARVVGRRRATVSAVVVAVPAVAVIVLHTVANWVFTGDTAAAGALAKLELYHPYLTLWQALDAWQFYLRYQVMRVTQYHFSSVPALGWLIWPFALAPLFFRSTRRYAALLWASAVTWVALVALNGQVRWQNERYTMPAVAWFLASAALGTGALWTAAFADARRPRLVRASVRAGSALAIATFAWFQAPRFRDQVWFFGRASRNILEQHMQTGAVLRNALPRRPHRVLVGDAGAIPFVADIPALDIIGLGGYKNLPFSRATRLGVGAAIELIERMPRADRPDVMAIYPSWWGDLPTWFGRRIAEIPVLGNVICGGPSDVIYRADWGPLEGSDRPLPTATPARVLDSLDQADVVSETDHHYRLSRSAVGFVVMKLLPRPTKDGRDLWDAGRIIPPGVRESFRLRGNGSDRLALIFRMAPAQAGSFEVHVAGTSIGKLGFRRADGWVERSMDLPRGLPADGFDVELNSESSERTIYHVWLVERP